MSAQLPYLPPLDRYKKDIQGIATGAAEDVRASQGVGAKAGNAARGVLAAGLATLKGVNDTVAYPYKRAGEEAGSFVQNLFGGPPQPSLGLPALAQPVGTAAPATVTNAPAPATQQPVAIAAPGTLTTARDGNNVSISGDQPAPVRAAAALPALRADPVAVGIAQQTHYAEQQRQAVLEAAATAAAAGNPDNASYRYAAALNALPHLSGTNNFAGNEAQLAAQAAQSAEQERSNIRTTDAYRYNTNTQAEQLRRNAQPTVIGEEINPDPTTRVFAPTIKRYGFVTKGEDGKIEVRDMQGTIQKPPAPPVTRSEFITKNKKANPGLSEADIGREYDKKYGGKT